MTNKIKKLFTSKNAKKVFAVVCVMSLAFTLFAVTCFAEGETGASAEFDTEGISTVLVGTFNDVITSVLETISSILPSILMIMGVVLSIGLSIKFFKKLTKNAS